jgi:hypothetical protein
MLLATTSVLPPLPVSNITTGIERLDALIAEPQESFTPLRIPMFLKELNVAMLDAKQRKKSTTDPVLKAALGLAIAHLEEKKEWVKQARRELPSLSAVKRQINQERREARRISKQSATEQTVQTSAETEQTLVETEQAPVETVQAYVGNVSTASQPSQEAIQSLFPSPVQSGVIAHIQNKNALNEVITETSVIVVELLKDELVKLKNGETVNSDVCELASTITSCLSDIKTLIG